MLNPSKIILSIQTHIKYMQCGNNINIFTVTFIFSPSKFSHKKNRPTWFSHVICGLSTDGKEIHICKYIYVTCKCIKSSITCIIFKCHPHYIILYYTFIYAYICELYHNIEGFFFHYSITVTHSDCGGG